MNISEAEQYANEVAAKRADTRTPFVVRRAFLAPFCRLTLRGYFSLEELGSPLVTGKPWPFEDVGEMSRVFLGSYAVLFPDRKAPSANRIDEAMDEMWSQYNRAFSTWMKMKRPITPGALPPPSRNDGLGWQTHLIAAALRNQIWEPLDLPLDQLFVLSAAGDFHEGMECAGEDYRDR